MVPPVNQWNLRKLLAALSQSRHNDQNKQKWERAGLAISCQTPAGCRARERLARQLSEWASEWLSERASDWVSERMKIFWKMSKWVSLWVKISLKYLRVSVYAVSVTESYLRRWIHKILCESENRRFASFLDSDGILPDSYRKNCAEQTIFNKFFSKMYPWY